MTGFINPSIKHVYDKKGRLRATIAAVNWFGRAVFGIARASTSKKDWPILTIHLPGQGLFYKSEEPSTKEGERIALERLRLALGVYSNKQHPSIEAKELTNLTNRRLIISDTSISKGFKYIRQDVLSGQPTIGKPLLQLAATEAPKLTVKATVKVTKKKPTARNQATMKKKGKKKPKC